MPETFKPAFELQLYCRFCRSTLPAQLERSIAGSGRTIDKEASFEYICPKCQKSHFFHGKDIIEDIPEEPKAPPKIKFEPKKYKISERFLIGEKISHPSYESIGIVVGKDPGVPNKVLVKFEKTIASLVEGINKQGKVLKAQ